MKVMELSCEPEKYLFWCPACHCCHWFKTTPPEPQWTRNNNIDKPTVRASILVRHGKYLDKNDPTKYEKIICHLYITDGNIEYLSDCTHNLAGKTVEMEHVPGTE
jgi:hypothetical protein